MPTTTMCVSIMIPHKFKYYLLSYNNSLKYLKKKPFMIRIKMVKKIMRINMYICKFCIGRQ